MQTIRHANRAEQIPIFALGVGFDANMDLLKDITDRTPGNNSLSNNLNSEPQFHKY